MGTGRKATIWAVGTALLAASPAALAQSRAVTAKPPVAAGANASSTAANRAKNVDALLQQGIDALSAGQYQAAREAFQDVVALDPRNGKAFHGLALCMMAQKDVAKASTIFDKGFAATPAPDRAMVLNAAACGMATHAHMRAAKVVKDYLSAHPKEADEAMVNALGSALQAATPQERKNGFFAQCTAFYQIANQRLEAARPGYKRFGAQWLPAKDAETKLAAIGAKQKQLDSLGDAVMMAQERLDQANKELDRQKFLLTHGEPPNNYYLRRAQSDVEQSKDRLDQAKQKYDDLRGTIELPAFPKTVELVAMDSTTTPPVDSTPPVVASIDPEVKPILRTRPTPPRTMETTPPPTGAAPPEETVALEPPRRTRGKVRITQYAAAFPVAPDLVLTSASVIDDGATLQLQSADGQGLSAELVRKDAATGLALLRVTGRKLHPLAIADTFNGGAVTCASFPTVDLFSPAAQTISGSATAPKDGWTVALNLHPRLAGAPLIAGGKVVGVCTAPRDAERNKLPAVTLKQLKEFLGTDAASEDATGTPTTALLQLVTTRESGE
jgi:Tfp pilus assembly protein PilF